MNGALCAPRRAAPSWLLALALALLSIGLFARNANDYFIGDDFDLIHSFYGKPASYFPALLWSNESGDVWKSWGIDPALGRGYLRPVKIWLLALDAALWGTNPLGFHVASSLCFAAVVLLVFGLLCRMLPERTELAAAGAAAVALHPVFAELVPFITAREELLAIAFGLGAFLAYLSASERGRAPILFHALYAMALLSKESAIVYLALPLGFELARGGLRAPERWRSLARRFAPSVAMLAGYFALRFVAFGNFLGGDGEPTRYLSPAAFLDFHRHFWRSLADPTLFSLTRVPGAAVAAAGIVALLALAAAFSARRASERRLRSLWFFGPLWYAASTAILHGTYFAVRHNALPVIGILMFATLALGTLLESGMLRGGRRWALGLVAVAALLFLPPTLATGREWQRTAAGVAAIRAEIEARSAGLPPGCTVALSGVPQWVLPPFFFGWGLRSALQRPFTASDLARNCTVYDARNLELTRVALPPPDRYDAVIEIDASRFVTPELARRHRLRLWREGVTAQGDLRIP